MKCRKIVVCLFVVCVIIVSFTAFTFANMADGQTPEGLYVAVLLVAIGATGAAAAYHKKK